MPKSTYKIKQFHGGINTGSDPRDIEDNECVTIENLSITNIGRITTLGQFDRDAESNILELLPNRGLFSFKSDKKLDGTDSNETFIAAYDDGTSAIDILDSDGWDSGVITLFDSDLPVFYVGDGNLRIGDGEFDNAINNKWFGYISENRFNGLNASLERFEKITVACVADSSDSLDGKYFDIYGADNHKTQVWIDVDNSGTSQPTGSGSYIHNIEVTGIATNDSANTVATQVAASINANSEFSASADTNTVTITLIDSGEKTDAHAGNSGFTVSVVTTGNPLGWRQSNQAVLKPTLGHCLISTPTAGSDSDGVNSSNSEYIGNVADGSGGDVLDLSSVNLRVGLQYNSYRGGNAAYYNGIAGADKEDDDGSGSISVYPLFGDNNIFINGQSNTNDIVLSESSSITLTEEKSILFGIWINETNHAKLNEIKFRATETGTSPNTDLTWEFQPDEVKTNSWNVFVCNLTNIIEGDATGVGLDSWTLTVTRNATELDFYFSGIVIGTNPALTGFQPGEYTFYYSYLYDEQKQESIPFKFIDVNSNYDFNKINIIGGPVLFNFDAYIHPYNSGGSSYNISERITGSRLYYKMQENDNYYLIGELDYVNNGFKWLPEGDEMAYSMANTSSTASPLLNKAAIVKGISPNTANVIDTFRTINGYGGTTGYIDAKFKTAVVHGRRTYIGNIRQPSGSDGKNYPDRMLKSAVNKFDVFPDTIGSVDVAINDGESIIKLEGYADRILQFKEKTLYIINISENVDFLEDVYTGKGCLYDYHVTKTDYGIAWFNKFGVYFYDGQRVSNLLEKDARRIINEQYWDSFITDAENLGTYSSNTVEFSNTHPANTSTLTFQVGSEQVKTIQFLDGAGTNQLDFQGDHIADTYVDNFLDANFAESLCEHVTGIVNSMSNLSASNNGATMTVTADTANSSNNITIGSSGSHNTTIGTSISGSSGDGSANDSNTANAHIGYIPNRRQILIRNFNGDVLIYDFILRAWIKGIDLALYMGSNPADRSNFTLDGNQDLIYLTGGDGSGDQTPDIYRWDSTPANGNTCKYITKDIDFGHPSVRKKIYKVYITYTSGSAGVLAVKYGLNGDTTPTESATAITPLANNNPKWTRAEYRFSSYGDNDINNCYSFQLQLGPSSGDAGFELNDITIVYRLKNVK